MSRDLFLFLPALVAPLPWLIERGSWALHRRNRRLYRGVLGFFAGLLLAASMAGFIRLHVPLIAGLLFLTGCMIVLALCLDRGAAPLGDDRLTPLANRPLRHFGETP